MKQVFRYDSAGFYVEPVILRDKEEVPSDCTELAPPNGLYRGKFVSGEWTEGLSEAEICEMNPPSAPSELEQLKKQQTDLVFELMMKGVL